MAELQHITPEQIAQYGVVAAPDRLTGRAEENKMIFDRLVRELVAVVVNAIIDKTNELLTDEAVREENENERIAAELLRVEAENLRVQAESARVTSEEERVQAEANRVSAELLRVQAENLRVSAEQNRVFAEQERSRAEQAREQAELERVSTTEGIVARATDKAVAAEASARAAASSEQSASESASAAKSSANQAENAKSAASGSASSASSSASDASRFASSASGYASTASVKAGEASGSASAASNAASAAKTSETNAKSSETAAREHMEDAQAAQRAIENMTVSVKTLAPGSDATATKTTVGNVVNIEYGIPRGEQGQGFKILGYYDNVSALESGVPSPSIGDAYGIGTAAPYDIYIWDGVDWKNNGPIQGPDGQKGENGADGRAATVRVGTVTTGAPGSQATVNNSGTQSDAVLDFTIPRGADGQTGADGKSAYQAAVEKGYTGTEEEFNAALAGMQDGPFLPLSGGTIKTTSTYVALELKSEYAENQLTPYFDFTDINGKTARICADFSDPNYHAFRLYDVENDDSICLSGLANPKYSGDAANKDYVDSLVGNINSALDAINGEVV